LPHLYFTTLNMRKEKNIEKWSAKPGNKPEKPGKKSEGKKKKKREKEKKQGPYFLHTVGPSNNGKASKKQT